MGIIVPAFAQTYQDTHLFVNGVEIPLSLSNPELSTISTGQVYGTIHISEPETINCTLVNCVSSVETDTAFGGWVAKVSGTMVTKETSEIQIVNSQGVITYTIVLLPEQKQITAPDSGVFGVAMPSIPYYVYVVVTVVGVAIILIVWRNREVGQITRL